MTADAARGDRLVVPDVLRGVALFAMLIAHAVPFLTGLPGAVHFTMIQLSDLASPLFALVMGLSAQILAQRTPAERRGRMLLQQAARGLVLIALGLWMSDWGTWVAIVLSHLGLLLLVGAPILLLSTRWVIAVAVVVAVISDPVNAWAQQNLWPVVGSSRVLAEIASWTVLGSSYRLTNLLPFFLLGALLMRHGQKRDRVLWTMAVIAPLAYAVRPLSTKLFGVAEYASGSYPDTLHDVGLVFATYVVIVLLATIRRPAPARVIAVIFEPFRAIGAVALSLYLLHVAMLALWLQVGFIRGGPSDFVRWSVLVFVPVVAAWLWWRFIGVGPVEWLLGWVTGRPKRWSHDRTPTADSRPAE